MPPLSKKRRYAKSAMSLVERDISTGFFKTLKAATLIIIEDEIENETVTMLQTVTFIRLNEQKTEFAIEKYIAHDIKLEKQNKKFQMFEDFIFIFLCGTFQDIVASSCRALYSARQVEATILYGFIAFFSDFSRRGFVEN